MGVWGLSLTWGRVGLSITCGSAGVEFYLRESWVEFYLGESWVEFYLRESGVEFYLRQGGVGDGDDVLLPLGQDDDIVDGPLVVAVPGVERLPPAEAGAGGLGGQGQLVVHKPAREGRGEGPGHKLSLL